MFRFLFRLVDCGWICSGGGIGGYDGYDGGYDGGGGSCGNLQLLVVGLPDPCFVFSFISELPPALVHFLFHLGTLVCLLSLGLELVPPQITLWPNYHFCPCNRVSINPFKGQALSFSDSDSCRVKPPSGLCQQMILGMGIKSRKRIWPWQSLAILGNAWQSLAMLGDPWQCLAMLGNGWEERVGMSGSLVITALHLIHVVYNLDY